MTDAAGPPEPPPPPAPGSPAPAEPVPDPAGPQRTLPGRGGVPDPSPAPTGRASPASAPDSAGPPASAPAAGAPDPTPTSAGAPAPVAGSVGSLPEEVEGTGLIPALHRLDAQLFRRAVEAHDPVLDRVLPAVSRAADFSRLWMAVAAVLALTGRPRAAVRGLSAVALASTTANVVVKLRVGRVRPPLHTVPERRRVRRVPVTTSFPSGHTASAVAFAVAVGREEPALALPLGIVAAGVAVSRIWTGAHYPGDVVVGATIGALAGAAVHPAH